MFARVEKVKTARGVCWRWLGTIDRDGYGRVTLDYKQHLVHRVFYTMYCGAIHRTKEIDHRCRHRWCVNPAHLRAVTRRQNQENSDRTFTALNVRRKRCRKGHPLDGVRKNGKRSSRYCKTCNRERIARSRR